MNPETNLYADLVYVNQAIKIYQEKVSAAAYIDKHFGNEVDTDFLYYSKIMETLQKRRRILEKRLLSQFVEGYEE